MIQDTGIYTDKMPSILQRIAGERQQYDRQQRQAE